MREKAVLWSDGKMKLCGAVMPVKRDDVWLWELWLSAPGTLGTNLAAGQAWNQEEAKGLVVRHAQAWVKSITEAVSKPLEWWP